MHSIFQTRSTSAVLLAACCAVAGCFSGDEIQLVETEGTVTYQGKPVPGGSVMFMPTAGGPPAVANTDEQGHFVLSTTGRPGAVVGSHQVSITAIKQSENVSEEELYNMSEAELRAIRTPLIPPKYGSIKTSGLTATVGEDAEENQITFDLK